MCTNPAKVTKTFDCTNVVVVVVVADVHSLVQLAPAQGGHTDRQYRGGSSKWFKTHAVARSDIWRATSEARPRQDAISQNSKRKQSTTVH